MSIPGSMHPLFLGAAGQASEEGGYLIERSVRFNSADSAYLSRTPASAGNRKTWTWAGWVKRSGLGSGDQALMNSGNALNSDLLQIGFRDDYLLLADAGLNRLATTALFRDTSAWYHIVVAVDTTLANADDRQKFYVNGTQVTAFAARNNFTQNADTGFNGTIVHSIGRDDRTAARYFSGLLADIHFIDGQALDPSSFGEFDTNNVWQPIEYTGTYGTNGFHLPFSDNSTAAALGTDTSGLGNNWDCFNLSVVTGQPTSIASASGALPIYNTTDTYGATKGTGTRTDSSSSSLVLAVPMDGTNNGTTFTDESATIKGSGSAKTVTAFGNAKTITAESKYYGSSADFVADGTDYLGINHSSDLNLNSATNWTIEAWVYTDTNRTYNYFVSKGQSTTREWALGTTSTDVLFYWSTNGSTTGDSNIIVSHVVPTGRWNHIAAVKSSSTISLYVNGIAVGSGSFTTGYSGTGPLYVGRFMDFTGISHSLDGKINDLRIYNGVAKYTSNFNPPSSTQNPTIAAGNDSLVDSPTNYGTDTGVGGEVRGNYCTWNPLRPSAGTLSNGNLDASFTVGGPHSTISVVSGKWYAELLVTSSTVSPNFAHFGLVSGTDGIFIATYNSSGDKSIDNSTSGYGAAYTSGDVIGCAADIDAKSITFYKNGVSQGSVSWSGSYAVPNFAFEVRGVGTGTRSGSINFGQRPFAHPAPSGFKALCTANLPTPTIADGSTAMDVLLWSGSGGNRSFSSLSMSPDFVWIKQRNQAFSTGHQLYDIVRGAGSDKELNSAGTAAEGAGNIDQYGWLSSFDSNGFSVTAGPLGADYVNASGTTYAAWCWDAGSSTVSNTQGSITSQVRANTSAGFSIVTYTGTGSAATVGHGLGVACGLIILKDRTSGAYNWQVYHSIFAGTSNSIVLNSTAAVDTGSGGVWNSTAPTSTVFSIGTSVGVNTNGNNYVAYCWAPVSGYTASFSYTGNGSADGPFSYLGFLPKLILIKCSSTTGDWVMLDTEREGYNVDNDPLFPNLSNAEATTDLLDITSNGFKIRSTDGDVNANTETYIGYAWASNPFQYSRAR